MRAAHRVDTLEVVVAFRSKFPEYGDTLTAPIGRGLARTGLTPNVITTLGLVLTAAATGVVATGNPVVGGWILVAGGLMDTFDGAVARAAGRASPFGGFYDSVTDRISDGLILGGMAWWLRDQPRLFILVIVAVVAAEVTSYVRAKAEAIDLDCSVGMLERAERAILLMAGLIFHRWLLEAVLWFLAVGGVVTVIQRIHHVWCQIDRDLPEELVALTLHDRAWSRAFKRAARTFYGEQNFEEAERLARETAPPGSPVAESADPAASTEPEASPGSDEARSAPDPVASPDPSQSAEPEASDEPEGSDETRSSADPAASSVAADDPRGPTP